MGSSVSVEKASGNGERRDGEAHPRASTSASPPASSRLTRRYLVVCQAEHGEHMHVDCDTREEADQQARSCFMDCDCKPAIYEAVTSS